MQSLWVYVRSHVCKDMCAVQVYAGGSPSWHQNSSPAALHLRNRGRLSQSTPEVPWKAALASRLALGTLCLSSECKHYRQEPPSLSTYVGSGHMNSGPHTGAASALSPGSSACFPKRLLDKWCWVQWTWSKGNSKGCSYANKHNYLRSLERKWKQRERPIWISLH